MIFFRSKREQRCRRLKKWYRRWRKEPSVPFSRFATMQFEYDPSTASVPMPPDDELPAVLLAKMEDPKGREKVFKAFVDTADEDEYFANDLDKMLGLRTAREQAEYGTHWTTVRNKCAPWAIIVAVVALIISIIALFWTAPHEHG